MLHVKRLDLILRPDPTRVFFRPFEFQQPERILRIVARVMNLSEADVHRELDRVLTDFVNRHQGLKEFFLERFAAVQEHLITDQPVSEARKLLIGAYFTQEYSLESAALFNPSIVPHPDQSGLAPGSLRFVLSLRATGEGHISSIVFRSGEVDREGQVTIRQPTPFITAPALHENPVFDRRLFEKKLFELGLLTPFSAEVLGGLGESFNLRELESAVSRGLRGDRRRGTAERAAARGMIALARANYEFCFENTDRISERVIFPISPSESRGIEDARFVAFREDDGSLTYYATYTAFDGQVILPQLLETQDFVRFRINTLNGPMVQNKGMALFPRRINGHYAMLSRQDGENLYLMYSDMRHFWYEKQIVLRPTMPWEFVQVGNCGSPIETDAGWLVLTHGVGPMRRYVIGAILLDRDNPARVIGRLREPLLEPTAAEREGCVPNVLYSCGALVHAGLLILPYAMSDHSTGFATVPVADLLDELLRQGPM